MGERPNGRKKNQWVIIGFIMENLGQDGEMTTKEIAAHLSKWVTKSTNSRSVATRLSQNKSKGFVQVSRSYNGREYISLWKFEGELPEIPKKTLYSWEERLSLKG